MNALQINILDKLEQSDGIDLSIQSSDGQMLDLASIVEMVLSQSNYHSWKRSARLGNPFKSFIKVLK